MSWQDYILTAGQLAFLGILGRMAWDRNTQIGSKGALLNALILGEFSHVFWTLDLYGTSITEFACSILWAWIAVYRPIKRQS